MVWPIFIRCGFFTCPDPESRIKRWYFHFNSGSADLSADASTLKQSFWLSGSPGETSNCKYRLSALATDFQCHQNPRNPPPRLGTLPQGGLFTLKVEFILEAPIEPLPCTPGPTCPVVIMLPSLEAPELVLAPLKMFLEVRHDGMGTSVGTQDIEKISAIEHPERSVFSIAWS